MQNNEIFTARLSRFKQLKKGLKEGSVSIQDVNHFWNREISYKTDQAQFGDKDYWQSPVQLLLNGKGDCEDIAIGKFFTLIDTHDIYLIHCTVQVKGKKEGHMLCVVKEPFFLFSTKETRLDIQSRPITENFRFNKTDVFINGSKKSAGNASGIDKWRGVMERAANEGVMYGSN